jgi:hypothetical protein
MMPLTPGAQIDELRRALRESEQRRQAAEIKLADRERQLAPHPKRSLHKITVSAE